MVALRIAGLDPRALAVGGVFTAVIIGLAAQQTVGNLFAGTVLLSTRPFRVGEHVKLVGGVLAGQVDGIVGQLGLFYTTLISGADRIMVPNGVVIQCAVIPLREPERVELRARLDSDTTPRGLQELLEERIEVPLRYPPDVHVEEIDRDEVWVRIVATPINPADGRRADRAGARRRPRGRRGERERRPAAGPRLGARAAAVGSRGHGAAALVVAARARRRRAGRRSPGPPRSPRGRRGASRAVTRGGGARRG